MKLDQEERMSIRTLAGKMSQRKIAETFGVTVKSRPGRSHSFSLDR